MMSSSLPMVKPTTIRCPLQKKFYYSRKFRPVTKVNLDTDGKRLQFYQRNKVDKANVQLLFEITLRISRWKAILTKKTFQTEPIFCALRKAPPISNYRNTILIEYFSNYTKDEWANYRSNTY